MKRSGTGESCESEERTSVQNQRSNALPGTLQNFIALPGSRFHAGKFDKAKTFLQCYWKHGEPHVGGSVAGQMRGSSVISTSFPLLNTNAHQLALVLDCWYHFDGT